jgi:hypothetical protein
MDMCASKDRRRDYAGLLQNLVGAVVTLCLPIQSLAESTLQDRYEDAVKAARKGDLPSKVLVPMPANQPNVLLVTWMPRESALVEPQEPGSQAHLRAARDIWVSLQSEIQPRCKRFSAEEKKNIPLRIRQLLGLPGDFGGKLSGGFQVIEISTSVAGHVFRPCTDPDPHRTVCPSPIAPGPNIEISDEHRAWIRQSYEGSFIRGNFPWTQLGYTFDWAYKDELYGVSEYVVPKSAPVKILKWIPLEEFCEAS